MSAAVPADKSETIPFNRKSVHKLGQLKRSQSSNFNSKNVAELTPLPLFRDTPKAEHGNLFISKLQQCLVIFNFLDTTEDIQGKEVKRACLNEIIDYVSSSHGVITESLYPHIIK